MLAENISYIEQLHSTTNWLKQQNIQPEIGVVLGTGLNKLLHQIEVIQTFPYSSIPHFPVSTVEFHKGNLIYGSINGKKLLVMQGRLHYYEGYSMQQIVFPVRIMKFLGIKYLLLTNAAGGINKEFKKGDLVLINDHINLQSSNPLISFNVNEFGARFTDMSRPYHPMLSEILLAQSGKLYINLKTGVYAAVNGSNLETRAEYRYLKIIGADLVGMSTVPEVIAANQMQLPCAAVSIITDECDPDNLQPVNIEEIMEVLSKADEKLSELLAKTIQKL